MPKEPVEHKHYTDARAHFRYALRQHIPGGMVGICGMPGAGKTFLRNEVMRGILGSPDAWGEGFIPATEVMVLLDANAKFSSKAFAARAHRAVLRRACADFCVTGFRFTAEGVVPRTGS